MGPLDRQPVRVMFGVHIHFTGSLQADVSPVRFGRFASPPRRQEHLLISYHIPSSVNPYLVPAGAGKAR